MPETYLYQGEYAQSLIAKGYAKGYAKGMVKSLLMLLEAQGIALSDSDRERITTCRDVAQLELWLDRVTMNSTVEELFA